MPESDSLKQFGAYQKSLALFDDVVADLAPRVALCDENIGILTATIATLRARDKK